MQLTSACAVGSVVCQTVLCVRATTSPSLTISEPNGDWPAWMPSRVFLIASRMKSVSLMDYSWIELHRRGRSGRGEDRTVPLLRAICAPWRAFLVTDISESSQNFLVRRRQIEWRPTPGRSRGQRLFHRGPH